MSKAGESDATEEGVEVELIAQARALHAYVPTPTDEDQSLTFLAFAKGAIIDVIEMHESGWWEGCCNDAIGLFPGSYVEIIERFLSSKEQQSENTEDKSEERRQNEAAAASAAAAAAASAAASAAAAKKQEEDAAKSAAAAAAAAEKAKADEERKANEAKQASAAAAAAAAAAVEASKSHPTGGQSKGPAEDATEQLYEARRFALHFKAALDRKTIEVVALQQQADGLRAELEAEKKKVDAAAAVESSEGHGEADRKAKEAAEAALAEATAKLEQAAKKIAELKSAPAPAAVEAVAGPGAAEIEAMAAEVKASKMASQELQAKMDAMDVSLREAMDKATDLEAQLAATKAATSAAPAAAATEAVAAGPSAAEVEALNAELKLAKGARLQLQQKVDGLDMELREAKDKATELQAQLAAAKSAPPAAAAAAPPVELTDTAVLQAELKMAKQQRMALQQKVDGMDMELREAMDKAAEVGALSKQLDEAKAKIKALEGAGGGAAVAAVAASGGASAEELEEERTKRTRAENALKEAKKELEEAKKAGGSSSILTIKLQAMEKELQKARKQLETATAGPLAQLEEQGKELKEAKDKARKLESELDIALNRAAANEEAMQQKTELRAQLDELREQLEKGKDPSESKTNNPKYKLEKLEKENQELREKLLAATHSSSATPKLSPTSTPVGSPALKRANPPVKKVAPPPVNSAAAGAADSAAKEEVAALQSELAKRDERIRELEGKVSAAATTATASAAAATAAPAASAAVGVPKKLTPMDPQVHNELREANVQLAKRDARISELEGRLRDTMAQLSRVGIDASSAPQGARSPRLPATAAPVPEGGAAPGPADPGAAAPPAKGPAKKVFVKKVVAGGGAQPGGPAPKGVAVKTPVAAPPKKVAGAGAPAAEPAE